MQLLISKINNVKILQVGKSVITIKNKKAEASKQGSGDNFGAAKTVDLGAGDQKISLKFYTFDKNESKRLFEIIHGKRLCKLTDKFVGKYDVYVTDIKIVNDDAHVNKTVYEIKGTIQDITKPPVSNYKGKLGTEYKLAKSTLEDVLRKVPKYTYTDAVKPDMTFVDEFLNTLKAGIEDLLKIQDAALGGYGTLVAKASMGQRLFNTVKGIAEFPNDFFNLMLEITGSGAGKKNASVAEEVVGGVPVSNVVIDDLPQEQAAEVVRVSKANEIVNLTALMSDLKKLPDTLFTSQQEFEAKIDAMVDLVVHVGYAEEKVTDVQILLKSYANQKKYREIIELDIRREKPLVDIVYSRYGSLANYADIEALNGFKDNDIVQGIVKVFQ